MGLTKKRAKLIVEKNQYEKELNRKDAIESRIKDAKKTLDDIQKIRTELLKLEQSKRDLESIDTTKMSGDELSTRNSSLASLPLDIHNMESSLNNKLELENQTKQALATDQIILEQLENKKEDISDINHKLKEGYEKDKEAISKGNQIISSIENYRRLSISLNMLENRWRSISKEKLIPIIGDYGSGKSSFCNHLMNYFCSIDDDDLIPLFIPLGQLPKKESTENTILKDIFEFIVKEYHFNLKYDEFSQMLKNKKLLFILDALDEMSYKLDSDIGQHNLYNVI
ncbi:MAG: NACHT domain-containing protein [Nitrosopumilus sp.]